MLKAIGTFIAFIFKPIGRTLLVALAGQVFFLVSVLSMIPLRMAENPVVNYNLFYTPILALIFFTLFYRTCVEENESRGVIYGFFSALFAWPLLGEIASLPVEKGLITQFSGVNIKLLGGYFYVIAGWLMLKIMWRTKAVKNSVNTFFLVFLGIWTFELYMDNYSSKISIDMMPVIGNWVATVFGIVSIAILVIAWRTPSVVKKTVLGCLLYLTFSLFLMGSGAWKTPSKFYVKYEAAHIGHEIQEMQEEQEYMDFLKKYMLEKKLLDGKTIKYLLDRNLIPKSDVQEAFEKGLLKEKDANYLKEEDIIKEVAAQGPEATQ